MKIRITAKIPTEHAPQIGAVYKVTRTETGVLENEMEVVEK